MTKNFQRKSTRACVRVSVEREEKKASKTREKDTSIHTSITPIVGKDNQTDPHQHTESARTEKALQNCQHSSTSKAAFIAWNFVFIKLHPDCNCNIPHKNSSQTMGKLQSPIEENCQRTFNCSIPSILILSSINNAKNLKSLLSHSLTVNFPFLLTTLIKFKEQMLYQWGPAEAGM